MWVQVNGFPIEKVGEDDFVCVLANPQMLQDQVVDIPAFEISKTEPKPETKKKK